MTKSKTAFGPAPENQRIMLLDVLRGFALLGILIDNMTCFSSPAAVPGYVSPPHGFINALVEKLIFFFSMGEFYLIFSFLFGLGFSLQMGRAEARGGRFLVIYIRRLLILFAIGLAHAVFLWDGDILMIYAVLGIGLLLFRQCSPRTIVFWAVAFFLVSPVSQSLSYAYKYEEGGFAHTSVIGAEGVEYRAPVEAAQAVYGRGSYVETVTYRLRNLSLTTMFMFLDQGPSAFAMFLLGLYTGRNRIIENVAKNRPLIRRLLVIGLIIGIAGNLLYLDGRLVDSFRRELAGFNLGTPTLSVFYLTTLTLVMQHDLWRMRLRPFAAVGRMSLSNYLLQSLIGTTIFYGYGLALYGKVGVALGVLLSVVIYLFQVALSVRWMRYFRFGPIEWLWRSLTYGQWQPLRIPAE